MSNALVPLSDKKLFLKYIDDFRFLKSENKVLVREYLDGTSLEELANKYNQTVEWCYIFIQSLYNSYSTRVIFPQDSVDSLNLPLRLYNVLKSNNLTTISSLKEHYEKYGRFDNLRHLGTKSADLLYRALYDGLHNINQFPNRRKELFVIYDNSLDLYKGENKWGTLEEAHIYRSRESAEKACIKHSNYEIIRVKVTLDK